MSTMGVTLTGPALGGPAALGRLAGEAETWKPTAGEESGFAETLEQALSEVDAALKESDAAAVRLATGEAANLHEVVLATERANLALQFTMAIRNKLLEAYNELMRMPV